MAKKKAQKQHIEKVKIDEQGLSILLKEYDSLKEMFTIAVNSVRSTLNSYLTLQSIIAGGIILIIQLNTSTLISIKNSQLTISSLLFLNGIIGTMYFLSLTIIYTDVERFASGADELRIFLIQNYDVNVPPNVYRSLLSLQSIKNDNLKSRMIFSYFFPLGSDQFFVSLLTGLSFSIATFLILVSSVSVEVAIIRSIVLFFIMILVYNLISRIFFKSMGERMGVAFNVGRNVKTFWENDEVK